MKVLENDEVKRLWDFSIQTEKSYNDLQYENLKSWNKAVDQVMILPIVIGALGTVKNNLKKHLDKVDLHLGVDALQKTCLLGTVRIIRKDKMKNKGELHRRTVIKRRTEMLPIRDYG